MRLFYRVRLSPSDTSVFRNYLKLLPRFIKMRRYTKSLIFKLILALIIVAIVLIFFSIDHFPRIAKYRQAVKYFVEPKAMTCPKAIEKYGEHIDMTHDRPQTAIPRRLHQIFKDQQIPEPYHKHMLTWLKVNPGWEYFFWTDADAELMIKEKYPQYLKLFESYSHRLQRSDAMRYFILHQYGGVYSDLDIEALKPIHSFLRGKTCIIAPEPTVQTNLIFNLDTALTNCIMAGTAGHPFLEHILRSLPDAYRKVEHNWDVLHSTGPFFLNKTYNDYVQKYPMCTSSKPCFVSITDHKYLVPTIDVPDLKENCGHICVDPKRGALQRKACDKLIGSKFANDIPPEAYTNHLWLHLGWNEPKKYETVNICKLVPEAITYPMVRGLK